MENEILKLEYIYEENPVEQNTELLHKAKVKYTYHKKNDEVFWWQQSRVKWFKDGDANTSYFHQFCRNRRNQLFISKAKNNSRAWFINHDEIVKRELIIFFIFYRILALIYTVRIYTKLFLH